MSVLGRPKEKKYVCPECGKVVGKGHFACDFSKRGGGHITGAKKRVGNPAYYQAFVKIREAKKHHNLAELQYWSAIKAQNQIRTAKPRSGRKIPVIS